MARDRPSRYGPRGDRAIARDRPSRYGARDDFLRRCNARDRPSPYGARRRFLRRCNARDRPSRYGARRRFLTPMQCEGQALALRGPETIFYEVLYPIGKKEFDKFCEKWYHFKKSGQMPSLQCEGQALALRTFAIDAMRGTGPRPTGPGDDFLRRNGHRKTISVG